MRRVLLVLSALAVLAAAGCTSSGMSAPATVPGSTIYQTQTQTRAGSTTTAPPPGAPTPIAAGPTTAAAAASCPLLSTDKAASTGGMRLARLTVLKSGGKAVGCRFYPIPGPTADCGQTCYDGENLPPGNQAVIDIATTRYSTNIDAHNAIALIARTGAAPQQVEIGVDNIGVCYRNHFYAKDHGNDWACTFTANKIAVVVQTVAQSSSTARAVSVAVAATLKASA